MASLVGPPHPGSNPRARVPAKSLMDIKDTNLQGFSSSPKGQSASREGTPDWGKCKEVERKGITVGKIGRPGKTGGAGYKAE